MDRFAEALLSRQANSALPLEDDWFAPLLGDWEFDYQDRSGRRLQGEWYFRRALDGMAIEDLFICPSRDTREENPQPDGEYGAAVRMYNRERRCYDMTYICSRAPPGWRSARREASSPARCWRSHPTNGGL